MKLYIPTNDQQQPAAINKAGPGVDMHYVIQDSYAAQHAAKAERERQAAEPRTQTTRVIQDRSAIGTIGPDGQTVVRAQGSQKFTIPTPVRPGNVFLPGVGETSIEAAKAAGMLPASYKEGDPLPFDGGEGFAAETAPQNQEEQEAPDATHQAAAATLNRAFEAIGRDATLGALGDVAETGELPDVSSLPAGFTEADVQSVVAGFVAQADRSLAVEGASVAMMEETLDADDLLKARRAVVSEDHEALRAIGRKAVERFASLPRENPALLDQWLNTLPADQRAAVLRHDNGSLTIRLENGRELGWSEMVRLGKIKVIRQ